MLRVLDFSDAAVLLLLLKQEHVDTTDLMLVPTF
jgi:hypothetical protein